MNKIVLLDTGIATGNVGDEIIMECVQEELSFLLKNSFVYHLPTHVPAFHSYAIWKNSTTVQNFSNCTYKFAGGSNLLVKNMLTHYPQWNVNIFNYHPLTGTILVGVGAGAGEKTNLYTTHLYRKMLNGEYHHSVRDERSKKYVESMGLKAINTGCVTMWKLTPEFCKAIPSKKATRCVFTITGNGPYNQQMVDILKRNYDQLFFWIQGDRDWDAFGQLKNTEGITIVPPSKDAYHKLLCEDNLDYVGTRLHGGVYAMRHKKRAIIIAIDERATEINRANNLNCISQGDIPEKLEAMIQSEFETKITMPFEEIEKWKLQFCD